MDFRKIVKSVGKSHAEVSKKMFPTAKFPYQAYTRVAAENIPLNENQLYALAEATGYSICQIMEMRQPDSKKKVDHIHKRELPGS